MDRSRLPELPPADLRVEALLIGALLIENRLYDRVSAFLAPEHFADPVHISLYAAMARRIEAGQQADANALRVEFKDSLTEVGGPSYISSLVAGWEGNADAAEVTQYGHRIRALADERAALGIS
jgi:replicative DNA helicase